MDGLLFLLSNGSLSECKERGASSRVCAQQSNRLTLVMMEVVRHSTLDVSAPKDDWLTLVESALVDMGWCKARAIKVYPMKEPNPGESDKRIIFNEQVDKFTRYKLSSGL